MKRPTTALTHPAAQQQLHLDAALRVGADLPDLDEVLRTIARICPPTSRRDYKIVDRFYTAKPPRPNAIPPRAVL